MPGTNPNVKHANNVLASTNSEHASQVPHAGASTQGISRIHDTASQGQSVVTISMANANPPMMQSVASPNQPASMLMPAELRRPIPTQENLQTVGDQASVTFDHTPAHADWHPDEYLFDGGDRALPVHYDEFNRLGIETEDTVVEYVDHLGQRFVKPTNRVAIYSPRFGAVRSASVPREDFSVDKLASAYEMTYRAGLSHRLVPTHHNQREASKGIHVRSRVSGLVIEQIGHGVDQAVAVAGHIMLLNAYEDVAFIRTGRFRQADEARLAYGIDAASLWTRDQNPVITAMMSSSQEVYSSFKPKELIGLDTEHLTRGQLRIVKLADKKVARSDDIITFTIRFDNLGDHELHHIRIIDNLTPRLKYIEDSAESDLAGLIVMDDNGEGNLILRFELDDSLAGHTGGVITFQTRVR